MTGVLPATPLLRQVSTAPDEQRQGVPERQQLEVTLHVSAASASCQGGQEPSNDVSGSASAHRPSGRAEQPHTIAHEALAAKEPLGEGQRSLLIPVGMEKGLHSETLDDGRGHAAHLPALHEVPSGSQTLPCYPCPKCKCLENSAAADPNSAAGAGRAAGPRADTANAARVAPSAQRHTSAAVAAGGAAAGPGRQRHARRPASARGAPTDAPDLSLPIL